MGDPIFRSKWFYGKAKVRDTIKVNDTVTTIVVSTQQRPAGTHVDDPEPGVTGVNSCKYNPPLSVMLFRVDGGTGEADQADPVQSWDFATVEKAEKEGKFVRIGPAFIVAESATTKTDAQGGEMVERRFTLEASYLDSIAGIDQVHGKLRAHASSIALAVIVRQEDVEPTKGQDEAKVNRRKKVDDAQQDLGAH